MPSSSKLKSGFTTGSAAAAAAKAATLLLGSKDISDTMDIPLPNQGRLIIPVHTWCRQDRKIECTVIKDGGDDPDATHQARISACVCWEPGEHREVCLQGGKGVGVVTKPGLPVPVGQAAINPAPKEQIRNAVLEAMHQSGMTGHIRVRVQVADGERIAAKTFNPRLGIVGGISILGTRGTVLPFSHQAYEETITTCLDAARAQGTTDIALCTGGRSERFLQARYPEMTPESCVLIADFLAFALEQAAHRGFERITYACFFGKLVKASQGHAYTHAKTCHIDFDQLADDCVQAGLAASLALRIQDCNTARQALEIIQDSKVSLHILHRVAAKALHTLAGFAGRKHGLSVHVFQDDGTLIFNSILQSR